MIQRQLGCSEGHGRALGVAAVSALFGHTALAWIIPRETAQWRPKHMISWDCPQHYMHDVYANICHGCILRACGILLLIQTRVVKPKCPRCVGGRRTVHAICLQIWWPHYELLFQSRWGSHSSSWKKQKRSGGKWGCHMGCINLNMCTASSSLFSGEQKNHAPRELEQEGPQGWAGSRASDYNAVQKTNFRESKACMFIYSTVGSGEATPTSS